MPNSRGDSQYAGLSGKKAVRKYDASLRVYNGRSSVRMMTEKELEFFRTGIQRIIDRERAPVPEIRRAVV